MEPYSGNWLKNVKILVASSVTTDPEMIGQLAYDFDVEVKNAALNNSECPFSVKLINEVDKASDKTFVSEIVFVKENIDKFVNFIENIGMTLDDVNHMPKEWFSSLIQKH